MAGRRDQKRSPSVSIATLSIGELADRTGVSRETIRYYERDGVVPTAVRGGGGRYRQYGIEDERRLRFVRRARELGFSLREVRELLALAAGDPARTCADINALAKSHLEQVESKLGQLSKLRSELRRLIHACNNDASIADCSLLEALSDPRPALGAQD